MLPLFQSVSNPLRVTCLLLDILNVKISRTTLEKEIEEHPDYPSLLSISDVLNSYNVQNLALTLGQDKFTKIPLPFIAQIRGEKSREYYSTVVKKIDGDSVYFFDHGNDEWTCKPLSVFLKKWTGIVLLTEAGDDAGEKDYNEKLREEKRKRWGQYFSIFSIPLLILAVSIFAYLDSGVNAVLPLAFYGFTLIGSIVGVLLLGYEVDRHNPLLKQICKGGKKVNCDAILQSKAAKIAGIKWSVLGFSYFTGLLLLLAFEGVANSKSLFICSWLNVLAVPYVFYSVYYQWRIARQWCILCLAVQFALLCQLLISLNGRWYTLLNVADITPQLFVQSSLAFLIPFIVSNALLTALSKVKDNKIVNTELQRLKHNAQVFEALLVKQKKIDHDAVGLGLTLGNPNATHRIIKVCNPYCGPCAKAHVPIEELLNNNPDIQVQIVFTATNDEDDTLAPPVKHLLAIAQSGDEMLTKQALDDWYLSEKRDYNLFAAKYPMNGELKKQSAKIGAMQEWCDKVDIEFTPTFFVAMNNDDDQPPVYYQLPETYRVNDLKYFFSV
ncbi:vitamin K epoxide reductase family protein [Mucilaginibacter rubeus]|uniref:Thioredoxin domain-containing protein n=1 Tax=Mucilaginibacter rubeus TaxID=2027860 RepID=A0A5C1I2G3_9SPHI|nr:vitamin K epoxide reductase family protein [Mucilaginibacter rubeus]QEM11391.1 thioredoxin domain-containing protein [Mucilaginibacter rubeus]